MYKISLPTVLLFSYSIVTFANDLYVIDKIESSQQKETRLNNLKLTWKIYQIKPEEKFTYTGSGGESYLSEMQVVYRNYSAESNDYIFISGVTGKGSELKLPSESVRRLSDLAKQGADSRINHWVLEKSTTSPAVKYYGDKYDAYHQRNIDFARKIINSHSCDTVMNVDVYSFGGEYLNAVCGDRRDIKQSLDDYRDNKPLDTSLKETYLVMPKELRDALRQRR